MRRCPLRVATLAVALAVLVPSGARANPALTVWIGRLILPRFAPEDAPVTLDDLSEVHQMISERIDSWKEQLQKQSNRSESSRTLR